MKKQTLLYSIIWIALSSHAQEQFTHTVTKQNISCNYDCTILDVPELNNNPEAIIWVTPILEKGVNLNPHPIGVYYFGKKWNIFNLDQKVLPEGSKFNVQYFAKPDSTHFKYSITNENIRKDGSSYIDHPALANKPTVQFLLFPSWMPVDGGTTNRYEIKVQYDSVAGKWVIRNINERYLYARVAYNIIISNQGNTVSVPLNGKPVDLRKDPKTLIKTDTVAAIYKPLDEKEIKSKSPTGPVLYGFADMHTHPVSQLGFGEQLFYGNNDGDPNTALGSCNCVHNFEADPFVYCGLMNVYRNQMVTSIDEKNLINPPHLKVAAFPNFSQWPKYNSILHQQMWIDWIKRAKEGGLRVMVALAVNSHTIADAAETGGVNDDLASMNKQLDSMKVLFGRHSEFLEIAYTSADLRRIVTAGNLAVILGIEMDNIGNFYNAADKKFATYTPNPTDVDIKYEIDRLFTLGVRYIFPIHITNNIFGGTALYSSEFSIANKYNTGISFTPEIIDTLGGIKFHLQHPYTPLRQSIAGNMFMFVTGPVLPPQIMPDFVNNYPIIQFPGDNKGHRNVLGLTSKGEMAIKYMMKKGMIIDIDHMSEKSATSVLNMATLYNYPVNSGHNGFRKIPGDSKVANENGRTDLQVQQIYSLGGMMGIGHGSNATNFVNNYRYGLALSGNLPLAIGTDVNGFFALPGLPKSGETITYGAGLTRCITGVKVWDFNIEGMAHYGLLPDYIESCRKAGMTTAERNGFFSSAERFAQMWEKCNVSKQNIQ
jgi:microsomal dipeptidase-like Zn-dependent dipeptidase